MHPVPPHPSATPHRAPRWPAGRLFRAALGYLLAFALTAVGFVGTAAGQHVDGGLLPRAERGGGYEQPTDLVEPAKAVLAWFGDPTVLGLLLVAVLLSGVLFRRPWAGLAGVALFGAAVVGAGVAKHVIIRPDLAVPTSTTHNSFPSGHVAAAAALLFAILLVLPAPARWWFAVPGAAGVSIVAAATMIAGWHRFSDVVGGVLLAAALFCLAAAVLARPRDQAGAAPLLGLLGAVGLVGLAGLLGGASRLGLPGGGWPGAPGGVPAGAGGLFVAIAAGSGLVVLVVAASLVLVHPVEFVRTPTRTGAGRRPAPEPDVRAVDGLPSTQSMIN